MLNKIQNLEIYEGERKELLKKKLQEYKSRINIYTTPEIQMKSIIAYEILKNLLERGNLDYDSFRKEMQTKYGSGFNSYFMEDRWKVIYSYTIKGECGGKSLEERVIPEELLDLGEELK